MKRKRWLLLGVVLALVSGPVLGLMTGSLTSDGYEATAGVRYNASNGPEVILSEDRTVESGSPFPDANTVELGNVTFSSSGQNVVQVDQYEGTWTNVSQLDVTGANLTINPDDKQQVTVGGDADTLRFTDVAVDDGTADFVYGGASGSTSVTISDVPTNTKIQAVDRDTGDVLDISVSDGSGEVTFEGMPNSEHTVELQSKGGGDPVISNGDPDGTIAERSTELTVDVEDGDFPNDEVTVEFYLDGDLVGTDTVTSNGTASVSVSNVTAGQHTWTAEATDDYGGTDSETYDLNIPDTLYIRDEENPEELVNGTDVEVEVTFYADDETITRTTSDGTIDLTGLPVDQTLVATASADGWQDRRILIRDIARQQSVYLLNETTTSSSITFLLEDNTGSFSPSSSHLIVQRSMNFSETNGSEWQAIAGDYFAADQTFSTTLETGHRYRLVIRNEDGDQRVLGSYTPEGDETTTLTVGTIVWDADEDESVIFDATMSQDDNQLTLRYNDTVETTDRLEIVVYERGNESNIVYETTEYDVSEYKDTLPLTENESEMNLVVEVYGHRSGEDFNSTVQLGEIPEQDVPVDSKWLSLLGQVLIVAVAGLVAGVLHRIGGIVVVSIAFALSWFGWVIIHPAALGFAGMLALFSAVKPLGGGV
jgi:hypothetical protein